jgi:hypothetical protein
VNLVGPAEFPEAPRARRQGRPARRTAGGSTGTDAGSEESVIGSDQCARAWEAAYQHYGHIWELTARSPKGDPAAAREMAAASWAVASAWRQIEAATALPWWAVAAIESAAAAFEEQARKYEGGDDSESHGHDR